MNKVFFTADHHFGHVNIIKYSNRPFADVEEMNKTMIERWNEVVGEKDTVYHLGDLAFTPMEKIGAILSELNGNICYIRGNHDKFNTKIDRFEWVRDLTKIKVYDQKIVLCHYAMRIWDCSHHGVWHLYGHSHGSLADNPNSLSFDVGVDCWNFYPISFEQVSEVMKKKNFKPVDHHT